MNIFTLVINLYCLLVVRYIDSYFRYLLFNNDNSTLYFFRIFSFIEILTAFVVIQAFSSYRIDGFRLSFENFIQIFSKNFTKSENKFISHSW